ncbi:hypothetical protein K7432_017229 [Basidiobolus ranarum]|uniref:Uncharacterized protein n=1 Tax=Basidiobolus ranarum TaxID=34480 RepID=A0ABR2WDM0_9FUNG
MKLLSAVLLMLSATLVSAGYRNCYDCYRVDDDKMTNKCCVSAGGTISAGGPGGPPGCYGSDTVHVDFNTCCLKNRCES